MAPGSYVLATIHRAENTDDPQRLRAIVQALANVAASGRPVVWPLHPRTRGILEQLGLMEQARAQLCLTAPVGYLDMVQLEKYAMLIATDSGGVQKEAFFHKVPCVTLRDETEWTELVEAGWNRLTDARSAGDLEAAVAQALQAQPRQIAPYGNGDAAARIAGALAQAA